MAVRDYREMYISTILKLGRGEIQEGNEISRPYLAKLTLEELKLLAEKLQGQLEGEKMCSSIK